MNPTGENGKNLISSPILTQIPPTPNFFSRILSLLDVRHCCKLSLYAIDPNPKNGKKLHFGPDLGPLGHNVFSSKIWLRQY